MERTERNAAEQGKGWTDGRWDRRTEQQRMGRHSSWCETDKSRQRRQKGQRNPKEEVLVSKNKMRKLALDRQAESDRGE